MLRLHRLCSHHRPSSSCQGPARVPTSSRLPQPCKHVSFSLIQQQQSRRGLSCITAASTPDTEEQRSPLDAPQEWEPPQPSKRPDIFPEFEKMDRVFLPKPLPGDPEMPDEEAEEAAKRTTPGDPDPEQKPGEPPEPQEPATEPGKEPEKPGTDIPAQPE